MMSELEVLHFKDTIPLTIVRPSIVYGPQERDMYEYFRMIRKGLYPLIGRKPQWINLVHAHDLVEAIVIASSSRRAIGETYFIGSEEHYTSEEIGWTLAKVVGRRPVRVHIPGKLVLAAGGFVGMMGSLTGRAVFFNLQKAR
jgi:nucleoside-diphosphate-sugar epimerase